MTNNIKLSSLIGFDPTFPDYFVLGTHDMRGNKKNGVQASEVGELEAEVNALLRSISASGDREALAAAVTEPIEQVVPYLEQFSQFFMPQGYGELEDNRIPVENIPTIAWQTHPEGPALYVRAGYSWTRPEFVTFDTAIDVPWATLAKAGWDFLARQMRRAADDLARKRDAVAKPLLNAGAVSVSGNYSVATTMTKASVDTILRAKAQIGFPVRKALINPARMMDMASFVYPAGFFLPPEKANEILTTLVIATYGGVTWMANPHTDVNKVWLGGEPSQIGWHQTRGQVKSVSDIDIDNKRDKHLLIDQEHAWYIGNSYTLATLDIT